MSGQRWRPGACRPFEKAAGGPTALECGWHTVAAAAAAAPAIAVASAAAAAAALVAAAAAAAAAPTSSPPFPSPSACTPPTTYTPSPSLPPALPPHHTPSPPPLPPPHLPPHQRTLLTQSALLPCCLSRDRGCRRSPFQLLLPFLPIPLGREKGIQSPLSTPEGHPTPPSTSIPLPLTQHLHHHTSRGHCRTPGLDVDLGRTTKPPSPSSHHTSRTPSRPLVPFLRRRPSSARPWYL